MEKIKMFWSEAKQAWITADPNKVESLLEVYRASEVDAYRKAVRALVEAAKLILHNTPCQGFYPDCDCVRCKFKQAIAAVEARLKEVK